MSINNNIKKNSHLLMNQTLANRLLSNFKNSPKQLLRKEINNLKLLLANNGDTGICRVTFDEMILSDIIIMEDQLYEIE